MSAWLIAAPARAAVAPLCDPRGATVLAKPPALQMPSASLEVASVQHDCDDNWDPMAEAHRTERPAPQEITSQHDLAALTLWPRIILVLQRGSLVERDNRILAASAGVRNRVERPPR